MRLRKHKNSSWNRASKWRSAVMRMFGFRKFVPQRIEGGGCEQNSRSEPNAHVDVVEHDDAAMHQSKATGIQGLWRTRNQTVRLHSEIARQRNCSNWRASISRFATGQAGQRAWLLLRSVSRMFGKHLADEFALVGQKNPVPKQAEQCSDISGRIKSYPAGMGRKIMPNNWMGKVSYRLKLCAPK